MSAATIAPRARILSLVVFPIFALWQTRQAFFSPVPVILGGADQPDWTGTLWTWWWTWEALWSGRSPVVASENLFPIGLDPVAQYNLVDAVLLGWLIPAIGPTRGYNLAGLILLAAAGWTGWLMCRRLGVPGWASIVAGLLLQSSSMLLVEVTGGRLSQALVVFAGMAFVGILRLTQTDTTRKQAMVTGLFTALAALTYWYAAVFVAMGAAPSAATGRRRAGRLGLAVGTCVAICAPALFSLLSFGDNLPGLRRSPASWMPDESWTGGSFGIGMAMSSAHQLAWPIWTAPGDPMDKRLSVVLLGLAAVGAAAGPRRWRAPLVGAALVGWVCTLGPWLKAPDGTHLPIPLPWLLLHKVMPFFERLWWPERFELTVLLGLIPLAGMGAAALGKRWGDRRVGLALVAVWGIEQMALSPYSPIPATPPPAWNPALYAAVDGPIITAPVLAPDPDIRYALWLQVLHRQPVTAGLGEHLPGHVSSEWRSFVEQNGLLSVLYDSNSAAITGRVVTPADVSGLRARGLRWVVVDSAVLPRGRARFWLERERRILTAVWGPPDVQTTSGSAWRIEEIDEIRKIPSLSAPRKAGPQGPFRLRP